jgi:hypothetical protein
MAALPQPWKSLSDRIYKIEESLKRLQNASPFSGTGLSIPEDGTTQVEGNLWVTGDFTADGKINNDALTAPVVPATAHADAGSFSSGVAWSTKCSVTVPVPSGYTKALVLSLVTAATAKNTTAARDFLYTSASISGMGSLPGWVLGSPDVPAGAYGVATDYQTVLLTGLSGSFTVEGQISTGFATWAADSGNKMNLDISLLFLR